MVYSFCCKDALQCVSTGRGLVPPVYTAFLLLPLHLNDKSTPPETPDYKRLLPDRKSEVILDRRIDRL